MTISCPLALEDLVAQVVEELLLEHQLVIVLQRGQSFVEVDVEVVLWDAPV